MGMWDALFAGLGGGIGAAGTAVAADRVKQEDKATKAQQLALQERGIAAQEKAGALNEELTRYKMDEEGRSLKRGGMLADILSANQGVPTEAPEVRPEGAMYSEATPIIQKLPKEIQTYIAALRTRGDRDDVTKPLFDYINRKPAAAQPVTDNTTGFYQDGKFTPVPQRPQEPFTAPEGYVPEYTQDKSGRTSTKWSPPKSDDGKTLEERVGRARLAHRRNPTEQTKAALDEVEEAFTVARELARARGEGNMAGRPTSIETAQAVAGAEGAKRAALAIGETLKDPAVDKYVGPYGQYLSELQRRAPGGLAGDVPSSVVDMEQNVAKLKNYTIRLITGAAVRKDEEGRIMNEIVDTKYPPKEFRQRYNTTLRNITELEQRLKDLALSGDQRSRAEANALGLLGGDNGKGGVNLSTPVDTRSGGASKAPAGPVEWTRDAQGRPVPKR